MKLDDQTCDGSYPPVDTWFYPSWCYSNASLPQYSCILPITCTNQLLLVIIPFLNCFPLIYLMVLEIRVQKSIGFQKPTKLVALLFMLLLQICVFMHYMVTNQTAIVYFLITQEFLSSLCFLAICFLFCRNSSKLLPNKKKFLQTLKILGIISVIFYLITFAIQIFQQILDVSKVVSGCKSALFIIFSIVQLPVQFLFIVAGYFICRKIQRYVPVTEFEYTIHQLQKQKLIR